MREKNSNSNPIPRPSLAALLSSLISQVILLLLLLFPSSDPISLLNSFSSTPYNFISPLLHHFISTSEIAAAISVLTFPRKRKRTRFADPEDEEEPASTDSVVPKSPDSFKQFFRMNSSTFEWLCGLLEPLLECRDPVDSPLNLPAEARLGIGLFRLATGSDYPEIANRFRVSEIVAKFCVKQLCRVLCTNYRFWVGFPTSSELNYVSSGFEKQCGLPNCCGIIGCARFKIIIGKGFNTILREDTISAQIVTDSSSRILSITAGFRGNKSEDLVLKSSTLCKDIEKGILLNSETVLVNGVEVPQYLVGGKEYPLLPWLIIPFVDPLEESSEKNFNNVINIMRLPMLKTIGSLRKWGILNKPIDAEFKAAVAYVGSCSILHNMLLTREDFSAFCDDLCDDLTSLDQGLHCSQQRDLDERASAIRSGLVTRSKNFNK